MMNLFAPLDADEEPRPRRLSSRGSGNRSAHGVTR